MVQKASSYDLTWPDAALNEVNVLGGVQREDAAALGVTRLGAGPLNFKGYSTIRQRDTATRYREMRLE